MNTIRTLLLVPALLASFACDASAEVDEATRKAVIAELGAKMNEFYVFPDKARLVAERLNAREQSGAYRSAADLTAFAAMLTEDLRQPTNDKHLGVRYRATPIPPDSGSKGPTPEQEREFGNFLKSRNYDIRKVETLPGNIGYIDLRSFAPVKAARPALGAMMSLVADTDALIVDLRYNGGGDPHTVAFMSGYLFDKRTHLNNMYWREGNRTDAFWTEEDLPGKKFGGSKKVYVLTSKKTFSGAEEFSYNLQQLRRGVIVGETTGGGAHPGGVHRIHQHLRAFIPMGRAINPISKTNWEGSGVVPDVKVDAEDALRMAERLALTELLKSPSDDEHAQRLRKRLDELK
ncbi:S41 family peptidase [Massilia sp. IC2-477]|uniref:S41 family peptidase n=1 Tax=Massilia sp. IC2-477 TaxID=2887198 RepID=UPI001D0FFBD8|nr:S41 family peptidase [Massilia sp. IC2-477]MCC2958656.1 S41 family peptidase [Massilia sp. IC2-477]